MSLTMRIRAADHARLFKHLFPGDNQEAVAFAICGRHLRRNQEVMLVHDIHLIAYDQCPVREPDRVTWRTESLEPLLERATKKRLGVVKFHSHPTGLMEFSAIDDKSDRDLFPSVYGWIDDDGPHASVVVLPDGSMFGRKVSEKGDFNPIDRVMVVGDDIVIHGVEIEPTIPGHAERHAQLFGRKTTGLLRQLTVGVVGCSGTGGLVIEMLARLGVGRIVLVDPDRVEYRNLNRIVGTEARDAALHRFKVDALAEHVANIGLGTEVKAIAQALCTREAVLTLAGCDVVFGCMDSHDGRRLLNRFSQYYLLPYFDCGVSLDADGIGGIDKIIAACHYFQPGASSVLDRRVIQQEKADAEAMARRNPAEYARLHAQGYIKGVNEDRPAVISVNALASSLSVNEMLARLHPYRGGKNQEYASVRFDLTEMCVDLEPEQWANIARQTCGRGDLEPLLDMPELSKS